MKRLTISTLLSGVLFLTSCNDFLNQEPLDQLSPNEYLTTESNIAAFATDQYQVLPTHGTYGYGTSVFFLTQMDANIMRQRSRFQNK